MTGDHQNRITDYTGVIVMEVSAGEARYNGSNVVQTLRSRMGTGGATVRSSSWTPVCVMGSSCWNAPFTEGGGIANNLCKSRDRRESTPADSSEEG